MLSRRTFMRSTAACAALAGTGLLRSPRASAASTWLSPASIDNTGRQNVSESLTEWLATTGRAGDIFKLRRGPGFAPGAYWIPQGVAIRRSLQLDLNGCWLYTRAGDGSRFSPLHDDQDYLSLWPRDRYCISAIASNVKIYSSLVNARIQGGARDARINSVGVPYGIVYDAALEAQHGIKSLGDNNHFDLTNIAIEFVHGDGVYPHQGSTNVAIVGRNLGGPVRQHRGGILSTQGNWKPELRVYPGIHHTGRHGVAVASCNGLLVHGVSMWGLGRSMIDLEPAGASDIVENAWIVGTECNRQWLNWIAAATSRPVNNVVVADNINHGPINMDTRAGSGRHKNWKVLRNRGGSTYGGADHPGQPFKLDRIDGLDVRENFQHTKAYLPASWGIYLGSSTDVIVEPGEHRQFPHI